MTYAKGTTVTVAKSQQEVASIFTRYGVRVFSLGQELDRAVVSFTITRHNHPDLPIRVGIPLPKMGTNVRDHDQAVRECWRALVLLLKANLEAVERSIVSPEQAFLAYITDGERVVGDVLIPQIQSRLAIASSA
jgi:hypothetical protein